MCGSVPSINSNITLLDAVRWRINQFIDPISKSWNRLEVFKAISAPDCYKILAMELPSSQEDDFFIWKDTSLGHFSVKSGNVFL